ncbi:MAG: hypothetical protein ABR499_20535 [Gemmatimonadaceae bacterium]
MLAVACAVSAGYGELVRPTVGADLTRLPRRVMRLLVVYPVVSRPVRQSSPRRRETGREQEQEGDEPED